MLSKGNDRKRTFLLITIPILVLFFLFNTLPLIKGFLYSFTNSIEIPIILCYNKEKEYHPQKEDTL